MPTTLSASDLRQAIAHRSKDGWLVITVHTKTSAEGGWLSKSIRLSPVEADVLGASGVA